MTGCGSAREEHVPTSLSRQTERGGARRSLCQKPRPAVTGSPVSCLHRIDTRGVRPGMRPKGVVRSANWWLVVNQNTIPHKSSAAVRKDGAFAKVFLDFVAAFEDERFGSRLLRLTFSSSASGTVTSIDDNASAECGDLGQEIGRRCCNYMRRVGMASLGRCPTARP